MLTSRSLASTEITTIMGDRLTKPSTRYPVIFCHGAGVTGDGAFDSTTNAVASALVAAGYPVVYASLAGDKFGADAVITAVGTAWTAVKAAPWSAKTGKVFLAGGSMGTLSALNWARQNVASVGAVALTIPALDLDSIYQGDLGGYRAAIGTAYGVTYPTVLPGLSTHSPVAYPGDVIGFPIKLFPTSDDPLASNLAAAQAWAATVNAAGGNVTVQSLGTGGHVTTGLDTGDIVRFFDANGGRG